MWLDFLLFLFAFRRLRRDRRDLVLENAALPQQLAVFGRHFVVVQPDTVVRSHRTAWRIHWRRKSRGRRPGRPRLDPTVVALIRRLQRESPTGGTRRIEGERRKPQSLRSPSRSRVTDEGARCRTRHTSTTRSCASTRSSSRSRNAPFSNPKRMPSPYARASPQVRGPRRGAPRSRRPRRFRRG